MIHAKESGKPKINGVADEKNVYPGQMIIREISVITIQKITLDVRKDDRLLVLLEVSATVFRLFVIV
ncbi:MAG: hypothetical protein GVY07_00555 [Bacteroidetes bacterium]|jgi:hypothetical protein|nr:hypothetical protein [Bacteroidota bacterium]